MAASIGGDRQIEIEMGLLHVVVMSRTPLRERLAVASGLAELTEKARLRGLARVAAHGSHLIACLGEESNDYYGAANATIESAARAREADPTTTATTIANTARCLLHLQRAVPRAESLLAEAQAMGVESVELLLGFGYLYAHQGRSAEAVAYLERALLRASRNQDHWREWLALARLATMSLENRDFSAAAFHCERMRAVAEKMSGGSEGARTEALCVVQRYASGESADLERALAQLREIDSKSDLAWSLAFVAELENERGLVGEARRHATEAVTAAEAVGRESDAVIAHTILGRRLTIEPSPDLTARARERLIKEQTHGHPRSQANV